MTDTVRKGMPDTHISKDAFRERFRALFYDPAYAPMTDDVERLLAVAWDAYRASRKSPVTVRAGDEFADPNYQLSEQWLDARKAVQEAAARHNDPALPSNVLIINASPRNDHTCPGEMSKTFRLVRTAEDVFTEIPDFSPVILDLSRLTAEYGRQIYPCKACFSTSPVLCHWPCSCYPNHSLGQSLDWMNEIYPLWVAAHGIMIISPVHWYQAPSVLKLMIDRLVCADGGNPDPTRTHGKDAERAKQLEDGWPYPRHLAGRVFSIVTHGDAAGVGELRRSLTDWLTDMHLRPAGDTALIDRYIGYYKPYAISHEELDGDDAFFIEVRHAALALAEAVKRSRAGDRAPGADLPDPRPK